MKTVHYSRIKLTFMAAFAAILAWGCLWAFTNYDGKAAFAGLLVAPVMGYAMVFALRYLADNRIAEIGPSSIDYFGVFGAKTLRYDQIVSVDIETTSVNFVSQRHLAFKTAEQSWGKTRIAEILLERGVGKLEGILDAIANPSPEPVPSARPARRLPREHGQDPSTPSPRPASARVQGFGRKGV